MRKAESELSTATKVASEVGTARKVLGIMTKVESEVGTAIKVE